MAEASRNESAMPSATASSIRVLRSAARSRSATCRIRRGPSSPYTSRSTLPCTHARAGWKPAASSTVTTASGTAEVVGMTVPSSSTPTTYAPITSPVINAQTSVRRMVNSRPHSR